MNAYKIARTGVSLAMSIGVGIIIENAIKATTPEDVRFVTKVLIKIGSFGLGGAVAVAVDKAANEQITDLVESVKKGLGNAGKIVDEFED